MLFHSARVRQGGAEIEQELVIEVKITEQPGLLIQKPEGALQHPATFLLVTLARLRGTVMIELQPGR